MPYLFSWSPDRITPTQPAQISVWDRTNAPASLSIPVTVVSGLVSFSVPTTGSYRVSVRSGYEIETGTFTITGDGTAYTPYTTYSYTDGSTDIPAPGVPPITNPVIRQQDLTDSITSLSTSISATYAPGTTTIPKWVTATAYTAGRLVISPNGDVVSAIANHTSGGTFNPANWNLSPTYAAALPTASVAYNASGQVTSVTENGITETYARDSQGRVTTITRNAVTKTITRDSAGRVTGIA